MPQSKKILLIYTGGTIGMVRQEEDPVFHPFDFAQIESQFPEIEKIAADTTVKSFDPPLDSSNIGPYVWIKLATLIEKHYHEFDGFVILHGSDTMAYTASAMSFMLEGLAKPVIFTGSQLPIGEIRTDAKENLITAIEIASQPDTPIREVCIYFEYHLYRANRTKKVRSDSFSAFNSPNFRPLALAGIHIKFYHKTPVDGYENMKFHLHDKLINKVGLLKFFPGISRQVLETTFFHPNIEAIIMESYGVGNLPTDKALIEMIEKSIESGKILYNITQCVGGSVEMGRYTTSKKLLDCGVIGGRDITLEAAVTKMMYLLGKYPDKEKVKHFLGKNIRGEMTAPRGYTVERQ